MFFTVDLQSAVHSPFVLVWAKNAQIAAQTVLENYHDGVSKFAIAVAHIPHIPNEYSYLGDNFFRNHNNRLWQLVTNNGYLDEPKTSFPSDPYSESFQYIHINIISQKIDGRTEWWFYQCSQRDLNTIDATKFNKDGQNYTLQTLATCIQIKDNDTIWTRQLEEL